MREKASAISSALVGVCGLWRLLRREVIGVYWEDWGPVEDMVMNALIPGLYHRIRQGILHVFEAQDLRPVGSCKVHSHTWIGDVECLSVKWKV